MFAVWLLPVVTFIVASSSGNVLAGPLKQYSVSHALTTVAVSGFIVSIGLSLSLMILTIYLSRLIIYGYPQGATILSSFLPLGPLGQAGYSIMLLGENLQSLLPLAYGDSELLTARATGDTIRVICLYISFVLWSLATMWMLFALLGIQEVLRKTRFPFDVPFWGLIFPNGKNSLSLPPASMIHRHSTGVYANLTLKLSSTLDSPFFRVYGAIYSIATLILWIAVATRTTMLLRNQRIFNDPCLEDIHTLTYDDTNTTIHSTKEHNINEV